MKPVFHGGGLDRAIAEYDGVREDWLDLSTGINPNPYPVPDIAQVHWANLPDTGIERDLLDAARIYYQIGDHHEVVAAAGTQALIQLLPRVVNSKEVTILSPTYGEYEHVWNSSGVKTAAAGDLADIPAGTELVVVVNPNNPDARVYDPSDLIELAGRVDCLIVDEAFCDPAPGNSIVPKMPNNVIVLKSFGKFFGLAGLRLGFAICTEGFASMFRQLVGPWAVSGPALVIGTTALSDADWIIQTQEDLAKMASNLKTCLEGSGFETVGVNPLFVYAKHGRCAEIIEHLKSKKILVRPFPDRSAFLRVGLPSNQADLDRLQHAIAEFTGD